MAVKVSGSGRSVDDREIVKLTFEGSSKEILNLIDELSLVDRASSAYRIGLALNYYAGSPVDLPAPGYNA